MFVVLAAAVVLLLVLTSRGDDDTTPPGTDPTPGTSGAPVTTEDPTGTTGPETTAAETTEPATSAPETTAAETTPTTEAPIDDDQALALMGAIVDDDRATVESYLEQWVPQLSAKTFGTEWEGVTYDHVAIRELHLALDAQYGALLIDGSEFVFRVDGERMDGWFVTIADVAFADPQGALDWCSDAGIDRENCAAKLITDRQDETSTLRLQP